MKLDNYYLDLKKVSEIKDKQEREQIHSYYREMLHRNLDGRNEMAQSYMNTLLKSEYLVNIRDEKIEQILS
jgi:hypothetical protein